MTQQPKNKRFCIVWEPCFSKQVVYANKRQQIGEDTNVVIIAAGAMSGVYTWHKKDYIKVEKVNGIDMYAIPVNSLQRISDLEMLDDLYTLTLRHQLDYIQHSEKPWKLDYKCYNE